MKKLRKMSLSAAGEKFWAVFSEWIRRKDADERGMVKCFTCDAEKHWKQIQAGHFISRRHAATKYDEMNVKPQCVSCNIFKQGNQYIFGKRLDLLYGEGTAESLEMKSKMMCKRSVGDYLYLIDEFKMKLKRL